MSFTARIGEALLLAIVWRCVHHSIGLSSLADMPGTVLTEEREAHQVAPARLSGVVYWRVVVLGGPADEAYLDRLAILILRALEV